MARALVLVLLLLSCSAPTAAPVPTEDPRVPQLAFANTSLQEQVAATKTQLDTTAARLANAECCGTFSMWNIPATIRGGSYIAIGLPDTFTVAIRFTTDHPVRAWVMDLNQYVAYATRQGFVPAATFGPASSVDSVFHLTEGCSGYVLVIAAPSVDTIVTPDIEITRHAYPGLLGACAR